MQEMKTGSTVFAVHHLQDQQRATAGERCNAWATSMDMCLDQFLINIDEAIWQERKQFFCCRSPEVSYCLQISDCKVGDEWFFVPFSALWRLDSFDGAPTVAERNLKCCSNFCFSSRESSSAGSQFHTPLGPRKRVPLSRWEGTSFTKGQNVYEWPTAPQFGHLELNKESFCFRHSSMRVRRRKRSSLPVIPNKEACALRIFFLWFPVRRLLTIPATVCVVDIIKRKHLLNSIDAAKQNNKINRICRYRCAEDKEY